MNVTATEWLVLAALVALCVGIGAIGGWSTSLSVAEWYPTLNKPSWNPPSWIFGPVWTVLYVLMAVAAWLVWRKGISMPGVTLALTLFLIQLTLNGLWSYIFFGARSIGGALVDILLLLIVLSATAWVFWRQSQAAGLLLLPYLAWVAFASALNFTIWRLNP